MQVTVGLLRITYWPIKFVARCE